MTSKEFHALIVDDEPELREVLRLMVQKFVPSVKVQEASDGVEALALLSKQYFQLLILDMKMPRMDGSAVVKNLASLPEGHHPKQVIVLSGNLASDTPVLKPGAVIYMSKPADKIALEMLTHHAFEDGPKVVDGEPEENAIVREFLQATYKVFETMTGITVLRDKIKLDKEGFIRGDVSSVLAINSPITLGSFALSFDQPAFLEVVSGMLGEETKAITVENSDAAGELVNQIYGLAKKQLNNLGFGLLPSLPAVVNGMGHQIRHVVDGACFSVSFTTPARKGKFTVSISIKPS